MKSDVLFVCRVPVSRKSLTLFPSSTPHWQPELKSRRDDGDDKNLNHLPDCRTALGITAPVVDARIQPIESRPEQTTDNPTEQEKRSFPNLIGMCGGRTEGDKATELLVWVVKDLPNVECEGTQHLTKEHHPRQ